MASYFDHFIVTKLFSNFVTDSLYILLFVLVVYSVLNKNVYLIPSRFQLVMESVVNHWVTVVEENLGSGAKFYILPITSLFLFLLGINLMGFFLFSFPCTTHISLTFGGALVIWLGALLMGFRSYKLNFFSMVMPSGAPLAMSPLLVGIELASNLSRPVALGMRLAANLTAGHILLAILADFSCKLLFLGGGLAALFPVLIIVFMTILEIGVLVIQAYVFSLLSMIYLRDSLTLH
jgi:ATP synthase subunit 6